MASRPIHGQRLHHQRLERHPPFPACFKGGGWCEWSKHRASQTDLNHQKSGSTQKMWGFEMIGSWFVRGRKNWVYCKKIYSFGFSPVMPVISWDQLVGCVFTPIIPGGKLEDGGEFQCFPMDFTWLLRPWAEKSLQFSASSLLVVAGPAGSSTSSTVNAKVKSCGWSSGEESAGKSRVCFALWQWLVNVPSKNITQLLRYTISNRYLSWWCETIPKRAGLSSPVWNLAFWKKPLVIRLLSHAPPALSGSHQAAGAGKFEPITHWVGLSISRKP